jgi:Uri superfamily endonuclease
VGVSPDAGIYQLLIRLPEPRTILVGALGEHDFAAGWYVYTGSMRRGLSHRLRRHAAAVKPLRWHIDYLTTACGVAATRTWPLDGDPDQECATHRALAARAGVTLPVAGFGSSDCRCASHLCHLGPTRAVWDRES